MELPKPLPSQYCLRSESVSMYASNQRDVVTYKFNKLGYAANT